MARTAITAMAGSIPAVAVATGTGMTQGSVRCAS